MARMIPKEVVRRRAGGFIPPALTAAGIVGRLESRSNPPAPET
jgi:hypothetical protein